MAIGAGCDFLTPIGHQCNTLVMGPGGYRFGDYWRLGLPLSVLVIDIDHFKQVNERHGSEVADQCLRQVAEATRRLLQPGDLLARYGGEEFLVALPGRQPDQARQLGERMREAISTALVRTPSAVVKFTASIGVAGRGGAEDTPRPLVERAERAMQGAKRDGRNQVQVAPAYGGYGSSTDDAPPEDRRFSAASVGAGING